MLNRELMTSRKFRSLSWEARTMYCAIYPFADRDGRIPGDHEELWASTGAAILIDVEGFAKVAREIIDSGLWIPGTGPDGDPFLEVRGFADAQKGVRYDRERPGRWDSGSDPDEVRTNSGPDPDQIRTSSGLREGKGKECELKGNGKGMADGHTLADIRGTFGMAFEEVTQSPATLSPKDLEAAREALELGTCDRFPDLKREFVRTLRGLKSKNLRMSLRAVLNNLGGDWGTEKAANARKTTRPHREGDPFGDDPATGRPYHPGA